MDAPVRMLRGPVAAVLGAPLALLLLLAGCAGTGPAPGGQPPSGEQSERPLQNSGVVEHQVGNRAVALLWDEAEQARQAGNLKSAVASLERAVGIAPDDPVLWSRLAELRFRQRDFAVAENLAAKSNALAGDRNLLRFRNWLIIAEARHRRGDQEGAEQARARVRRLQGEISGQGGSPD